MGINSKIRMDSLQFWVILTAFKNLSSVETFFSHVKHVLHLKKKSLRICFRTFGIYDKIKYLSQAVFVAPKFICGNSNTQHDGIWRWGYEDVIKPRGWSPHYGISVLAIRETKGLSLPCEDNAKALCKQEECSHQEPGLPPPWSWPSQCQNCEK